MKIIHSLLVLAILILVIYGWPQGSKIVKSLRYIITETGPSTSFDPLNADKTHNLPVLRMMYLTPLEINSNNILTSKILESFEYNPTSNEIIFVVKNNLKFQDGSPIETSDVVMAIKRMAYFRPGFPILRDIEGVKLWADSKRGLSKTPTGIRVTENKIIIKLVKNKLNPLFRFCLELFSIIPSRCIDLNSGALTCEVPSESGYYRLVSRGPKEVKFEKRMRMFGSHISEGFDEINFEYKSLAEACNHEVQTNAIITGSELDYIATNCAMKVKPEQLHWLPASRFGILRFNPNINPFNDANCRITFAAEVRNQLRLKGLNLEVEASLFTKILPGYLPEASLDQRIGLKCRELFRGQNIVLPASKGGGVPIISKAIIDTAKVLGMNVSEVEMPAPNPDKILIKFLKGDFPVVSGASGFWAQDPIGDLVMWFTPNLHKTMSFVWSDRNLYSLIDKLDQENQEISLKEEVENLNKYINEQSVLAPVIHFKRLFITSKQHTSINLPQAITSPAPWQIAPKQD